MIIIISHVTNQLAKGLIKLTPQSLISIKFQANPFLVIFVFGQIKLAESART
jgi:hypothetical protein